MNKSNLQKLSDVLRGLLFPAKRKLVPVRVKKNNMRHNGRR